MKRISEDHFRKKYLHLVGVTAAIVDTVDMAGIHAALHKKEDAAVALDSLAKRLCGALDFFDIMSATGGHPYKETADWKKGTAEEYLACMEPADRAMVLEYMAEEQTLREEYLAEVLHNGK